MTLRTTLRYSAHDDHPVLAVATAFASVALGFAGPARADQVMQGVYTYTQGDVAREWTIYPICVPTVGDLRDNMELPVACRLHVVGSRGRHPAATRG